MTKEIINVYVPHKMLAFVLVWCGVLLAVYALKGFLIYFINRLAHCRKK
ncbi:MAG: hypothetical protein LBL66_05365 [Clostridiales bacterium]|nr:hypothetical protein [Clostridiales bacterium]